jgi:hypothetical protein
MLPVKITRRELMGLSLKSSLIGFAAGAAATALGVKAAKGRRLRAAAVKGLAAGISFKEEVLARVETIREDAQDLYEEARRSADEPAADAPEVGAASATS